MRPKAEDAPLDDEEPQAKPSKMYKLNKRNIKRDEKAKQFIEKTKREL